MMHKIRETSVIDRYTKIPFRGSREKILKFSCPKGSILKCIEFLDEWKKDKQTNIIPRIHKEQDRKINRNSLQNQIVYPSTDDFENLERKNHKPLYIYKFKYSCK